MNVRSAIALLRNAALCSLEYRINFVMAFLASLGWAVSALFFWQIIFEKTNLPFSDTIFLALGFLYLFYAFDDVFLTGLWVIEDWVISGDLDTLLMRPVSSLPYIVIEAFDTTSLPNFLIPLIFFTQIKHPISFPSLLLALSIFFAGAIMLMSLRTIIESLCFWFGRENAISTLVWGTFYSFEKYPVTMYPGVIRMLFSIIIPLGFVQILPANALVYGMPIWAFLGVLSLCLCFLGLALAVWQMGLNRYESAGG